MSNRYFDCQKCLSNEKNDMQKLIPKDGFSINFSDMKLPRLRIFILD